MERTVVDTRDLVERLWRDAKAAENDAPPRGVPELPPADHILHREALAYLNRGYLVADLPEVPLPEGSGLRVQFRRRVTRIAAGVVRFMLERHLVDYREFLVQLVRFENELAKKSDVLGDEIRAVAAGAREEMRLLAERVEMHHRLVEDRLARLEARSAE